MENRAPSSTERDAISDSFCFPSGAIPIRARTAASHGDRESGRNENGPAGRSVEVPPCPDPACRGLASDGGWKPPQNRSAALHGICRFRCNSRSAASSRAGSRQSGGRLRPSPLDAGPRLSDGGAETFERLKALPRREPSCHRFARSGHRPNWLSPKGVNFPVIQGG
jgi:hypothetical protein